MRACTATAAAPARSQTAATCGALTEPSSHPARSLTVTGTGTAAATAATIAPQRGGFFISALPAPEPVIFGAGQPMLMSMASGENAIAFSAARAITGGSEPKIWIAAGRASSPSSISSSVFLSPNSSAFALTISLTVYAAPKRAQVSRNARSPAPAMGASTARPASSIPPIFRPIRKILRLFNEFMTRSLKKPPRRGAGRRARPIIALIFSRAKCYNTPINLQVR